MKRINTEVLVVNDDDLNCNKEGFKLEDINLSKVGFVMSDLKRFGIIIYQGKLGTKVLKL